MYRVLLVDDDEEVLAINGKYLKKEGYLVETASTSKKGLEYVDRFSPNCIVLDVMMPNLNGFDTCKEIRRRTDTPIIFLTAKTSENDKIKGLLLGGDDYMIKPYSIRELSARIHANIRRHLFTAPSSSNISYPPLNIDIFNHKVYSDDEEISLTNREYELLVLLVSNPNRTVTFQEIGEKMWGIYTASDRRCIMVNASRLRKKLENYIGLQNIIETVWSQGYKFVAR